MRATLILVIALILVACGTPDGQTSPDEPVFRKIELPVDTIFSVGLGEGDTAISTVTVPDGHPDAGTYTTDSPHLHGPIGEAMKLMGKPGARAWIQVDEEGVIQFVTTSVTVQ